jgi:tetratricopeptide (TPR) repeat protein/predicted Ser/Thr protein kinase
MMRCPTDIELERFLGGDSIPEEARVLRDHLERCAPCRNWCDEASRDDDLVPDLKRALDRPLPASRTDCAPPHYRVLGKIGAGGMGVVFEAEQEQPQRRVALKVLPGGSSAHAARRFEVEAEALARLEHEGIARIFEAGTFETPEGPHPFFAMELVRGRTLDVWLSEEDPPLQKRLKLFALIGEAVAHAHMKGVVHRDLKPANVVVTDENRPKVLDFGIARVGGGAAETVHRTQVGQLVGTIATMSPEQAAGDPRAIDTRTDVYSLGALLYRMLTGQLPHDLEGLTAGEALQRVAEEDIVPARQRDASLHRDLETILSVALKRDVDERYGSVDELVGDVRRFLRHEPIAARPSGALERMTKFVRRNRTLVAAATVTFAALSVGIVATAGQARRARAAESDALRQVRRSAEAVDFLRRLLGGEDRSGTSRPAGFTLREALDESVALLDESFSGEPDIEADLRVTIGSAYLSLALFEPAERQLAAAVELRRRALGGRDVRTAEAMNALAALCAGKDQLSRAEELYTEVLDIYGDELGADDPRPATTKVNLAGVLIRRDEIAGAERLLREALATFERTPVDDSDAHVNTLATLSWIAYRRGEPEVALELEQAAFDLSHELFGDGHPTTEILRSGLAQLFGHAGDYELGLALAREAESALIGFHGADHPHVERVTKIIAELEVLRRSGGSR